VETLNIPENAKACSAELGDSILYAQYVNRMHGRSGHLWQDRFFSCALDEEHFWDALVYG